MGDVNMITANNNPERTDAALLGNQHVSSEIIQDILTLN